MKRHAMKLAVAVAVAPVFLAGVGTAHAGNPNTEPPGQEVQNFGQCNKNGTVNGATPNPQSDPGGLGPTTSNSQEKLRGPLFASFKGVFPFDVKTPFEAADSCEKS